MSNKKQNKEQLEKKLKYDRVYSPAYNYYCFQKNASIDVDYQSDIKHLENPLIFLSDSVLLLNKQVQRKLVGEFYKELEHYLLKEINIQSTEYEKYSVFKDFYNLVIENQATYFEKGETKFNSSAQKTKNAYKKVRKSSTTVEGYYYKGDLESTNKIDFNSLSPQNKKLLHDFYYINQQCHTDFYEALSSLRGELFSSVNNKVLRFFGDQYDIIEAAIFIMMRNKTKPNRITKAYAESFIAKFCEAFYIECPSSKVYIKEIDNRFKHKRLSIGESRLEIEKFLDEIDP